MKLEVFPGTYSVCQIRTLPDCSSLGALWFLAQTDEEISLVCASEYVPAETLDRKDDWKMFRVAGPLDFSLTGILASLADTLAQAEIPIFAVSTWNTDYLMVQKAFYFPALDALSAAGHSFVFRGKLK